MVRLSITLKHGRSYGTFSYEFENRDEFKIQEDGDQIFVYIKPHTYPILKLRREEVVCYWHEDLSKRKGWRIR